MTSNNPKLKPFFTFYGGKWRAAPRYPKPKHDIIIEPFAGSAGYSVRHAHKQVILIEKDPIIAATWRYLISVSESEILSLPDIETGRTVDDLRGVCQEARYLIGWWLNAGSSMPKKSLGSFKGSRWDSNIRYRIASQQRYIRHWMIVEGDYTIAPDIPATWFIDPPYEDKGKWYRYRDINYSNLLSWCLSLKGQVMVCENTGANWLPTMTTYTEIRSQTKRVSKEALFYFETC